MRVAVRERERESVREKRGRRLCVLPPPVARTASSRSSPCSSPLYFISAYSVSWSLALPWFFPYRVFHDKSCVFVSFCIFGFSAALICVSSVGPRRGKSYRALISRQLARPFPPPSWSTPALLVRGSGFVVSGSSISMWSESSSSKPFGVS